MWSPSIWARVVKRSIGILRSNISTPSLISFRATGRRKPTAGSKRWNTRCIKGTCGGSCKRLKTWHKPSLPSPINSKPRLGILKRTNGGCNIWNYEEGFPIGSGMVESGCKQLRARFTGAGLRWSRPGAENLIPICTALLSERFDEMWHAVYKLPSN